MLGRDYSATVSLQFIGQKQDNIISSVRGSFRLSATEISATK